jgi:hypothetical protein
MSQLKNQSTQLPIILICSMNQDQTEVVGDFLDQAPPSSLTFINQESDNITIKQVREVINQLQYSTWNQDIQRIIFLNAHHMTQPAQNALLKILEETPAHSQLILVTSQPNQLLPTIQSRCQVVNLAPSTGSDGKNLESSNEIYDQLITASASQVIKLADQNKDRAQAKKLLSSLIETIHQKPPFREGVKQLDLLLWGLSLLEKNVNVRLLLEAVFFRIAGLQIASKNSVFVL